MTVPGRDDHKLRADFSLIRDYSREDDPTTRATGVTRFSNGRKTLYYVNAAHELGADTPTVGAVRAAVAAYDPQRIVIEAVPGQPLRDESVGAYAESIARNRGIPVSRGEPPDDALIKAVTARSSYTPKDIMALYLLRTIPQDRQFVQRMLRAGGVEYSDYMSAAAFRSRAEAYLARHPAFAGIPPPDRLTYEDFLRICAAHLGGKSFLDVTPDDFAPFNAPGDGYFQRMNAAVGRVREEHIVGTIADALNEPGVERVLTVYGGGHLAVSKELLGRMIAPGEVVPSTAGPDDAVGGRNESDGAAAPPLKPGRTGLSFRERIRVAPRSDGPARF